MYPPRSSFAHPVWNAGLCFDGFKTHRYMPEASQISNLLGLGKPVIAGMQEINKLDLTQLLNRNSTLYYSIVL